MTHTKLDLSLIVAMTPRGVIGHSDGNPLWHLQSHLDLARRISNKSVIVSDIQTVKFLRDNQIETWFYRVESPIVVVANEVGFEAALSAAMAYKKSIFVLGREVSWLYKLFIPYAKVIRQTIVHDVMDGDVLFPTLHAQDWAVSENTGIPRFHHVHDSHKTTQCVMERVPIEVQCVQD